MVILVLIIPKFSATKVWAHFSPKKRYEHFRSLIILSNLSFITPKKKKKNRMEFLILYIEREIIVKFNRKSMNVVVFFFNPKSMNVVEY